MGFLEDTLTKFPTHILNPVLSFELSICDVIVPRTLVEFRIIVIPGAREGLKVAQSHTNGMVGGQQS